MGGKKRSVAERLEEARALTAKLEAQVAQENRDNAVEDGRVASEDVEEFRSLSKDAKSIASIIPIISRYIDSSEGAEARELATLLSDFEAYLIESMDNLIHDEEEG
jgi:hypothetical protein